MGDQRKVIKDKGDERKMKCPKCGYVGCRYLVNRTKPLVEKKRDVRRRKNLPKAKRARGSGQKHKKLIEPRSDFMAECPKCGWKGKYLTSIDKIEFDKS